MSSLMAAAIDYDHRVMPNVLSYESQNNPKRLFALSAKSNQVDDGFREVTFGETGCASSYIAQWLQQRFDLEKVQKLSMAEWIKQVESVSGSVQIEDVPALRRLEVFRLFSSPSQFRKRYGESRNRQAQRCKDGACATEITSALVR